MEKQIGCLKLTTVDWLKLGGILATHAIVMFAALLAWANRIVAVEVRISNVEQTVQQSVSELRTDVKEILRRLPKDK